MILPMLIAPDPQLKRKAFPVEQIDKSTKEIIQNMFETMYAFKGCGLAATQVGILKRILIMDLDVEDDFKPKSPQTFINPEILWKSEETVLAYEACISVPDIYEKIERAKIVRFKYTDECEVSHEVEAEGLLAQCIQHEIDHLDGILFIDHLSRLKRERALKRLMKNQHIPHL